MGNATTTLFTFSRVAVPHCSVQWGLLYLTHDEQEITLPITSNGIYIILGLDNDYGCDRFGTQASASNKFKVWERSEQGVFAATNFQWVAICRQ